MHVKREPEFTPLKKRKVSESEHCLSSDTSQGLCSTQIREAVSALTEPNSVPPEVLSIALEKLSASYASAVALERQISSFQRGEPIPPARVEDWNWALSSRKVANMSELERKIWSEIYGCRDELVKAGIRVNPEKWNIEEPDLLKWHAHIPGPPLTPWAAGTYTCQLLYKEDQSIQTVPKCRFVKPLFHVNCYPSGTWAFSDVFAIRNEEGFASFMDPADDLFTKTLNEDPTRLLRLLRCIQNGLSNENINDPAASAPYVYRKNQPLTAWNRIIKIQAELWRPHPSKGLAGRQILEIDDSQEPGLSDEFLEKRATRLSL